MKLSRQLCRTVLVTFMQDIEILLMWISKSANVGLCAQVTAVCEVMELYQVFPTHRSHICDLPKYSNGHPSFVQPKCT